MAGQQTLDFAASQISFPLRFGRLPFVVDTMIVTNNTGATLYLSRSVATPTSATKDVSVPPRFSMPVYGWYAYTLYVGSDGTPLATLDSITLQLFEASPPFGGASLVSAKVPFDPTQNPVPDFSVSYGWQSAGLTTLGTAAGGTLTARAALIGNGYNFSTVGGGGSVGFQIVNPATGRPREVQIVCGATANTSALYTCGVGDGGQRRVTPVLPGGGAATFFFYCRCSPTGLVNQSQVFGVCDQFTSGANLTGNTWNNGILILHDTANGRVNHRIVVNGVVKVPLTQIGTATWSGTQLAEFLVTWSASAGVTLTATIAGTVSTVAYGAATLNLSTMDVTNLLAGGWLVSDDATPRQIEFEAMYDYVR